MGMIGTGLAAAASLLSALALYGASPHCRWPLLSRLRRAGRPLALLLAAAAGWLWIDALGVGAGLCVGLSCWMLGAISVPYLAAWTSPSAHQASNVRGER